MASAKNGQSARVEFWFVVALLGMIVAPVAVTLHTVRVSAFGPLPDLVAANPSPHGYTESLLIFIVPILLIAFWFLPNEQIRISKKAFGYTIITLVPLGMGLDFFFAHSFFCFPNSRAVIGIHAWALGGPLPVEEYVFYLTGFLAILLFYVWLDGFWLSKYSAREHQGLRTSFPRLVGFHPRSLVVAVLVIGAAILFKLVLPSTRTPGFPGYLVVLVLVAFVPSIALFSTVKEVINWRALSLTLFIIVLVSVLWEATLAIPYGWWGYQGGQMVGVNIVAWHNLPIEAVVVWVAVTYTTVIVYEAIRCWQASGKSARHAFLGVHSATTRTS